MADTNAQMEELARILEDVNREMAYYGRITKQTADDKFDAEFKNKTGLNNATKGLASLGEGLTSLAGAGAAAGKAMYEGKKGAAAFNDSIDGMAKAAQAAGVALALMIPGGPIIKLFIAGLTAAVTATAEYVKAANEMADKLYKGYSNMSQAGAAASDGMTGVYKGAKKLGLSMNELDGYVSLVGESSKDLALLSGSVYEGRKQFENMGEAMEPYRKSMIAAGMSQEMINQGAMGYLKLQTRIGAAQRMTTDQLADGARRYLIEQDALTKLTGTTRKENEAALEEARSQQRFRAKTEAMRASGDANQIAAADELEKTYQLLRSQSKQAAQGFGDMTTGMVGTEAAQQLLMSSNAEALEVANKMVAGQMKAIDGTQQIASAVGRVAKDMNMTYQTGVGEEFLLSIKESADLGLLATKDLNESYKKISQDQTAQGLKGGAAADKITEQYAKNIKQQQELNKRMEDAVFQGIDNALSLTNKLGNVTSSLTTAFETLTTGVNKLLNILGLGTKEDASAVKQQEIGTAESKLKEAQAAQKSAKTPDEKLAADREANFYKEKIELLNQEKEVIVKQEKNAKLDAEILKRADDEVKIKMAAFEKAKSTGTTAQQYGFNLDNQQKTKEKEMWEAVSRQRALREDRSGTGVRGAARADLAKQQASAPKSASAPASGMTTKTGEGELDGLTIKEGDVQAQGSKVSPKLIDMAKQVQANLPNFAYFSGFNDKYHQEKAPASSHVKGTAMDFVLSQRPSVKDGQEIEKYLKQMGASYVQDEYNFPSPGATGDHIHAQIPGYADGGLAVTPQIAMVAEKGPEAMIPLDNGNIPIKLEMPDVKAMFDGMAKAFTDQANNASMSPASMSTTEIVDELKASRQQNFELLSLMQELVRSQKDSTSIQERILQTSM